MIGGFNADVDVTVANVADVVANVAYVVASAVVVADAPGDTLEAVKVVTVTTIRAWVDATGFDSALISKSNAFKTATKSTAMAMMRTGDRRRMNIISYVMY